MPQQSAIEYLRHGQTPFFRLPTLEAARASEPDRDLEAYRGHDAVLLGVPFDRGTIYQPGARFAPYHVRRVSALLSSYHPGHHLDVFARVRAVDGGNVVYPPFHRGAMREAVEREVTAVVAAGAAPFLVGGDHCITLPVLRALARVYGPVALVHVDAHLDTSSAELWGDDHHHGTPIRHAVAEGLIAPGHLYQLGLRGPWGSERDGELSHNAGGAIYAMAELDVRGLPRVLAELRERVGARPTYLTFDIDAVDPAFAPGTGTPVPGGLTSREALGLVRLLAATNLVGMDVVEVSPVLDHADLTCHLAAHLLFEGLAAFAVRRGG